MGIGRSSDIDEFLDDADEIEGGELDEMLDEDGNRRKVRKPVKSNKASWRTVEDYLENKRLKKQLSEYYDED